MKKVLYLNGTSVKELPKASEDIDSIYIEGYASTNDVDRAGDVVPAGVWEAGLTNYLKNPIILAQHDHDDPIGRMVDYRISEKGLWIKARISAAAEVFNLVKDGVLTAFSIGFRVLDAEYNSATELFVIKELELIEISVVSVPCNQDTLFSLSKAFDNAEDYKSFKTSFIVDNTTAKGLEQSKPEVKPIKEFKMDPKELQEMLAKAARDGAEAATKAMQETAAAEKAAAEKAAAEELRMKAAVEAAMKSHIQVGQSGAEKLLADAKAAIEASTKEASEQLKSMQAVLAEKADELKAIQNSKMSFTERGNKEGTEYAEREKAVLLSKLMRKGISETKYGKQLIEKAGAHLPSGAAGDKWELEVSLSMEAEVRRRLVVAPLFRSIQMQTNVMSIPVNPEAGLGTWVTNAQFGTTDSPGAAQTHQMKEITLNAYKLATREYMNYEEEEDSLLILLPLVRDAMVRRVARSVDRAFLLGAGAGADPVRGAALYDATSVVTPTNTGVASVANLRALRKDLGAWGLDPSELVYVVSTEVYYDLLDDTLFQTMNNVGPQATLLTGQVGSIGNTPVLVSGEFGAKAGGAATASTNIGAICVAPGNFLVGNQRGLRFETDALVETQRNVLVASLRTGMTQVTTNLGQGVSTLRWS